MSLKTAIGSGSSIIGVGEREAQTLNFDTPVLNQKQLEKILYSKDPLAQSYSTSMTYRSIFNLKEAIEKVCQEVEFQVRQGVKFIRLTDRFIDKYHINIPSLLVTGAVHHHLIKAGLRKEVGIIVDAGDIWESHHFACLLSFGADLICPYLAIETCVANSKKPETSVKNYIKTVNKGLLKIMSKLGISTLNSYKGAPKMKQNIRRHF